MAFYTKLSIEIHKFRNYLLRAKSGDLGIIQTYGYEKTIFMMNATKDLANKKNITKILDGCIEYELWGFLAFLLTLYASYSGVKKVIMKNYQKIPVEYRASIVSVLCYCQKWSDHELNDLFLEIVNDPDFKDEEVDKIEEDEMEIYYALGWNESYQAAVNNPCWFDSESEAASLCFHSKIYFSKNSNIPEIKENASNFYMFGENELNNIYTVKTRVIKAKVKKADVLAVIDTQKLTDDYFPQINIIQNKAVYDIEEMNPFEVKEYELDYLAMFATLDENLDDDEFTNRLEEIYEILLKNCEKVGVPELIDPNKVQNKEMVAPKDVAMLIRTRLRVTQGNALKVAKDICKREKNARWVYLFSKGYRSKKGYYYRGLCYSAYTNKVFPILFQYVKDDYLKVIYNQEIQEECKDFTVIFAVDYQSESKTLDGCIEKCREIADPEKKIEIKTEVKTIKESLSEEEKESIKQQYREEVETEYQKKIQIHKDNADFKANELENLKMKYDKVLRENEELKRQLEKKKEIIDKQSEVSILSMGNEKEKYDGETHSMILSAIRHELKNCDPESRRYDVLESVLDKNTDDNDSISKKLAEIKKITKGYRIASEMQPALIKQGFQYTEDGRHPKIQYPDDDRYVVAFASTASDIRAGENLYALIKKKFF